MQILWMLVLLGTWMPLIPMNKGTLTLIIKNVEAANGALHIAIYDNEAQFLEKDVIGKVIPVKSTTNCEILIPELPFGKYAIAVFHDLNENGKLDKNSLGIPTEPYAFSNNPAAKWRSPTFAETLVEFGKSQKNIVLELKRWRKH